MSRSTSSTTGFGLKYTPLAMLALVAGMNGCNRADEGGRDTAPDSADLARIEYRLEEAHRVGNTAFLDSVYAVTFRFKHYTGELELRSERLAALGKLRQPTTRRDLDSLDIELHDDIALTTGRVRVRQDDEELMWRDYTVRYARVYVFRDGRWQLLTHHSTGLTFADADKP